MQTSDVCPSKIITSEPGISHTWDVDVVEISIGSGAIEQTNLFIIKERKEKAGRGCSEGEGVDVGERYVFLQID